MSETCATAELLVVDPSVSDAAMLLDGRRAGIEVLMLAAGGNALKQIADHLDGHAPLQALHILSHGESGTLFLAGEHVDASALAEQHRHLECIAAAMDQDATLYLYGCSLAAGTRGAGFLASLEAALGISVVASTRPVGSAALGGAWQFPLAGCAGAGLAFAPAVQAAYAGLLASVTLTTGADTPVLSAGDDTIAASLANSLNVGDSIEGLGGNDTLIISAAQSVTLGATTLVNVENITITAGIVSITTNNATVAAGQTLTVDASASAATFTWNGVAETDGTFHLTGGSANDTITGGAGNDTLSGGLGNDRISALAGNNTVYAGDGADFAYGMAGADLIYGEGGNDGLSGGAGNDTVWGGDGNDTLIGGAGDDLLYSEAGADWIWGQDGNDTISGGGGNDTVSGDAGNDTLYGGDDNDSLRGLADNDVLYGEAGTDTLSGGAGTDTLSGGDGVDQFAGTASDLNGDIVADLATGESIIVTGVDLSALNGAAASASLDLGSGMSLALTGISAASGSFSAAYNGSSTTITLSAPPANAAPVIGSDGGGATAALSAAENQLAVTTVAATDTDGDTLAYTLTGGADQASFSIDASTGVLSFSASPDYEAPADSDANNTYVVDVTASDGNGGADVQTITVTVTDANDAATITSDGAGATASVSAAENQSAVTTVTATDADGDTPAFSITGGADQSRFAIDAATGALSFVAPPDFEVPTDSDTNNTYVVDVTASDGNGGTDVQTITVTVTNANEAIAITSDGAGATAAVSAAEDQTAVTTVTATDADGDTPVFSITGGSDQAAFAIDAATGALSFVAPPDFEAPTDSDTNNTYVVAVTASDGNGGTDVQTITVTVTSNNAAPTITSNGAGASASVSAAENQSAVTTVTATDADGDTPVFSITGGSDQARFTIDAGTGALSFVAPPDFEAPTDSDTDNTYVVDVTASDGNGGADVQTITVTVTNANDAIAIGSNGAGATASVSAAENQSSVTTVTATDADGDTPVFSITGGSDQSRFSIDGSTGALSFVAAPNFESPTDSDANNTYVVAVTASDGNGSTDVQTITVTVTNVNEAIAITSDGAGATASVNAAENQTAVTTVTAADADGDTPVFSITGGSDQARFAIDAATGALSFVAPPDSEAPADSDTDNTYVVDVTASDGNGGTDVQTITVTVTDANDVIAITSDGAGPAASVSAAENQTAVTTVTATDADGDTPVFSITGGSDQGRFAIDAATGALSFVAAPDFEAPTDSDTDNTYVVDVTASDGNGGSDVQTITVSVTNANEAIAITSDGAGATASVSAAEKQTAVTTVTAADADGDTPVFSITGGSDQARFTIDAVTGVLSFAAPPNFEAPADSDANNTYVVAVTASDGNGGTDVQSITVSVTNENDTIAITSNGAGATASVNAAENQTAVTTVTASDGDGDTPVFSITGGSDQSRFTIDASSGELSFVAPPNFEAPTDSGANNTYVVAVSASDGEGGTDVQTITVTVTNANDAMAITSNGAGPAASVSVAENQAAVTTVTATDPDGDTPVFSIAGGSDQSRFSIDAASGALSFLDAPDFETPTDGNANNTYLVNVAASDGKGGVAVQAITVTVSDVDDTEPPPPVLDEGGDLPGLSDLNDTLAAALPGTLNASDRIDGKLGFDTLILTAAQTVVLGPATLTNFERIIVSAGIQNITTDDATVAAGMNLLLDASASADAIAWNGSAETDGTFRLLTGSGNDTVQGGQGSDVIATGLGQDILAGGGGNDAIDGGGGRDVVQFSGAGRTDYSLRVSGGQVIFTQLGSAEDGVDTLANVEAMQFTASVADAGPAGSIARLFDTLYDRAPTRAEADLWLERTTAGLPLRDIAAALLSSSEGQLLFSGAGNGAFVDSVYQQALGRPANATERSYWGGAIDSGGIARADAALLIADSDEKLALEAPLETDFNTTEIATFVRMYEALFDRRPDQAGINYWIGSNEAGNSMHQLASSILGTEEMNTTHGALSDQQFVDMLYQDGLERTASSAETGYWLELLGNGIADRAEVLMAFVNSTEMLELIGPINTSNILV